MTTIRYISDIHREAKDFILPPSPTDHESILVVAGDVDERDFAGDFFKPLCERFKYVVGIPGNHDYYGRTLYETKELWNEFARETPNFFHLDGNSVILDGIRFTGGTLWSDACQNDFNVKKMLGTICCFQEIKMWNPDRMVEEHQRQLALISEVLKQPHDGKTVVVTHFLPLVQLRDKRYPMDSFGWYWYNDLYNFINEHKFDAWIHGHTHHRHETVLDGRVYACNPRGWQLFNSDHTGFDCMATLTLQ